MNAAIRGKLLEGVCMATGLGVLAVIRVLVCRLR